MEVDEAKYLGVLLSSDLMWSKHIQHLVSKANSTMGLLRRNLTTSSAKLREQAFISLVRSRLEYCCAGHLGSSSSKGPWQPRSSATKGRALRNPRLLSGHQCHTTAEGPSLATAQGPKTGHSPISHVQNSNGQGGRAGWWYTPPCRLPHTQQARAQIQTP